MGKKKSSFVKMQQGAQRSSNVRQQKPKGQETKSAQGQGAKRGSARRGIGLMESLALAPEFRRDGGVTPPLEEGVGRFKHFWSVGRRRNSSILIANLMFMLFALPILAIFVVVLAFGGVERIAYLLHNIEAPYMMTDIGFGLSSSPYSIDDVTKYMADVYYILFGCAGVGALFLSIGLSGMMPLCMNFIIGDEFFSKKDNYGNSVPLAIKEFFWGVKHYWSQFLVVGVLLCALIGGIGNVFVYFITCFNLGTAGVGHWFMIIFAAAIALLGSMFLVHLMPTIVLYRMPFKDKMKNAAIFAIQMFVQNLILVAVFAVPFILIGLTNTIVSSIVFAVLLVYGSKYYCLTMCNYEQYISEKIVTPLYNAKFSVKKPQKNKK